MDSKEWSKRLADMDQGAKMILETVPPLVWGMFKRLQEEGFTETQAFRLVRDYFKSFNQIGSSEED